MASNRKVGETCEWVVSRDDEERRLCGRTAEYVWDEGLLLEPLCATHVRNVNEHEVDPIDKYR